MSKTNEIVYNKIMDERERQNQKWGVQEHGAFVWLAILAEEVGELSEAALHDQFGGDHAGTLEKELIQVAAVAWQWLESLQD